MPIDYRTSLYASYRETHYVAFNPGDAASRRSIDESYDLTFAPFLPPDRHSRILDVGCGSGLLLEWLLARGYRSVQGIDLSPDQVRYCKERGLCVEEAEAQLFLEQNQGFDLVVLTDILEHLKKDEAITIVLEIRKALNAGGAILIRTPNASSMIASTERWIDLTHELLYTEQSLRQLLRTCGFKNITVVDNQAPFGLRPRRLLRWIGLKVLRKAQRLVCLVDVGTDAPRLFGKCLIAHVVKTE
jgi:2-polyprenyl-3-methyl-5-hydroxy-6-metoxy-1,4-benzoquinol methylase